ncbi:hypothetical protein C8J57DRAFT_1522272 [Mycena rebaudengoi]|nr:hypothetical protein C8J57DRAFT_1522272 [Mycena rebaudengoi]
MPHPSLERRSLEKLPQHLQKIASIACERSLVAIPALQVIYQRISAALSPGALPSPVSPSSFLPVLYTVIEVPPGGEVDLEAETTFTHRAILGLNSLDALLHLSPIPKPILPDLWKRTWKCIVFLNDRIENLSIHDEVDRLDLSAVHASILLCLALQYCDSTVHFRVDPMVDATPHVRSLIATIWARMIRNSDIRASAGGYIEVLLFHFVDLSVPKNFREFSSGVGTICDLATLTTRHLNATEADIRGGNMKFPALPLLNITEIFVRSDDSSREYFLVLGFVKSLTKLLLALSKLPRTEDPARLRAIERCCFTLCLC